MNRFGFYIFKILSILLSTFDMLDYHWSFKSGSLFGILRTLTICESQTEQNSPNGAVHFQSGKHSHRICKIWSESLKTWHRWMQTICVCLGLWTEHLVGKQSHQVQIMHFLCFVVHFLISAQRNALGDIGSEHETKVFADKAIWIVRSTHGIEQMNEQRCKGSKIQKCIAKTAIPVAEIPNNSVLIHNYNAN